MKIFYSSLAICGCSILWLLSGCAVPDRSSSEPALPPQRALEKRWQATNRKGRAADARPLTLERAIAEALGASPELEQIRRRLDAAGEQVQQAEASFYPKVAFSEEFNITDNPVLAFMHMLNQRRFELGTDFNDPGRQQNLASRIRGEWSLFEGASRHFNRSAAIYQKESRRAELFAEKNRLVAKVTETYYRWLQALSFIEVAKRALESSETDERLAEARLRAGAALPSELLRLKTRTAESRSHLVSARTSTRRLQAALERLLARPIGPREIPRPTPSSAETGFEAKEAEIPALVSRAWQSRPEMAGVSALIRAARDRVRSARGGLFPRLTIQSQYEWDTEDFSNGGESWMVGVRATWPLFQGGLTLSKIREAQANLREIQSRGEQVALDIAMEVHQAVLGVREAAEKIKVAAERKRWAMKGLEEMRSLYKNEVVTVEALLQAEVAWSRAEAAYSAALFDGRIAQAALKKALGEFAKWMESGRE